jgi:hypothetical protein
VLRPDPNRQELTDDALQDLCVVAVVTIVFTILAVRFEWAERLFAWTRRWKWLELDELAFALLVLAVGLAWFSARRWRRALEELERRIAAERSFERSPPLKAPSMPDAEPPTT